MIIIITIQLINFHNNNYFFIKINVNIDELKQK